MGEQYYDRSIVAACTLDFDVTPVEQETALPPFQYDLIPPMGYNSVMAPVPLKYVNVFDSTENYVLDSVSTYVPTAPSYVSYEIYRVAPDAQSLSAPAKHSMSPFPVWLRFRNTVTTIIFLTAFS